MPVVVLSIFSWCGNSLFLYLLLLCWCSEWHSSTFVHALTHFDYFVLQFCFEGAEGGAAHLVRLPKVVFTKTFVDVSNRLSCSFNGTKTTTRLFLVEMLFLVVAAVLDMMTAVAAAAAACASAIFFAVIVTWLLRWNYGSKGLLSL
jgi:hypothetical protein